jgi:ABC-type branched-subunit amino acid transport system substrate-binding protein
MDAIVWFEFNPSIIRLEQIEKFSIEKATSIQKSEPEIKRQGKLLLVRYDVKVEFSTNLDHIYFPMNDHVLYIVLTNEFVSPNEMVFVGHEGLLTWSNKLYTSDWKIIGKSIDSGYADTKIDLTNIHTKTSHPRILYSLILSKTGLRKTALIFLPIFFILLLGAFSLTLSNQGMSGTVLSLAVGSLTGLLAYRFVIESISPNVGYFTLAERIYTVVLSFSFLTFILDVIQVSIAGEKGVYIPYIDGIWLYIMQGSLVVIVYYLLFRKAPSQTENRTIKIRKKPIDIKPLTESLLNSKFNLTKFKNYRNNVEEFPPIDNQNWLNPDYTSYYKKGKTLFGFIRNMKTPFSLSVRYFLPIVKLYLERNSKEIKKDHLVKISYHKESNVVIFGDLFGAFHSLVRDLEKIKDLGYIDNDLVIKEDCYIIFTGDVIDRSPYVLETLVLIIVILLKNPDRAILVRGEHESHDLWLNYNTYHELRLKLKKYFKRNPSAVVKLMKDFLSSLPIAAYLQSKNSFVCITHKPEDKIRGLSTFIMDPDQPHNKESLAKIYLEDVEIYFRDECKQTKSILIKGLGHATAYAWIKPIKLLPPSRGIITWSIFSAPISSYHNLLGFHFDNFGVIKTTSDISEWILTLYYQDIKDSSGYKHAYFHLLYGAKLNSENAVKNLNFQHEILLGSSLDLSKTSSILGNEIRRGILLGMLNTNSNNGINGDPVRLVFLDDYYAPYLAKKNINTFLRIYNTDIILSPVGTATVEAFTDLIRKKKILVLFPITGASVLRDSSLNNIVHFRPSYGDEADCLIRYSLNTFNFKRFAIFYQNDSFGLTALEGAKKTLSLHKHCEWVEASHERNSPNIDTAAQKIIDFDPSAILICSQYSPSVALIHKLGVDFLQNKSIMAVSYVTGAFRNFLRTIGLNVILSSVVPDLNDTKIPIINEFHQHIKNNHFSARLTTTTLEGYINFSLAAMILGELEYPYTKEKIISKAEAIHNLNYKGLELNFNPKTRELSENIWIDLGEGEWIPAYNIK